MPIAKNTLFFSQGNPKFEYADAALLGAAFDANASYGKGAADAPAAILKASWQMDIEEPVTGKTLEKGIHNFGILKPKGIAETVKGIEKRAKQSLEAKKLFVLLGGDHSVVNGLLGAVPGGTTFVNFDAHLDLREEWLGTKQSHAAIGRRIFDKGFKQVWVGVRDTVNEEEIAFISKENLGSKIFYCPVMPKAFYKEKAFPGWMHEDNMLFGKNVKKAQLEAILASIETEKVWINIDADCLDLRQGIETGVPLPYGLSLEILRDAVYEICRRKQVLGFNICELIPDKFGRGQSIAAMLCYQMLDWL